MSGLHLTNMDSPLAGTFLVDDVAALAEDLKSGNWASAALVAGTATLDTAATIADPLGSLFAAGLGWLEDHLDPLTSWLDELTGDAGAVEALARPWEQVAEQLSEDARRLVDRARSDLAHMHGPAVSAYLGYVGDLGERVESLAKGSEAMASAIKLAATIVEVVHGIVRDALAQVVGTALSAAAEEVFSLGLATPAVIAQVSTRVADMTARVSGSVHDLVSSVKTLEKLVTQLDHAVGEVRQLLDHVHPDVARGKHVPGWLDERAPHESGPHAARHAAKQQPFLRKLANRERETAKVEFWRDGVAEGLLGGAAGARPDDEGAPAEK